jgi:2-methylcitrate dehydratase PrpD
MINTHEEITDKLAEFIFDSQKKEYSAEVIHQFKRALLDYMCAAMIGSKTDVTIQLLNYMKSIEKSGICSVVGHSTKLSPLHSALVNGTSAHSLDFDDGHTHGSIHPASFVFPAVFAAAEHHQSTPMAIINAVITGYDVACRLSAALHPNVWQRGYHNTPVIGVFGSTAGVATLLKSNKEQIKNALGHAGSFSGGLFEFLGEGADTKRIHPGKAARDGILSAELAHQGITGPKKIFEGNNGFFRAFADNKVKVDRLFDGLHSKFEISTIYFKPYPCCRHLHGPIDAVINLLKKTSVDIEQIHSIEVGTFKTASKHNHRQTEHLLDAQMSIPCAVSLALVYGDVTMSTLDKTKIDSPDVQQLIQKVHVVVDDQCEELFPEHRPALLTVTMNSEEKLTEYVKDPRGESKLPLHDDELEKKLLVNGMGIIPEKKMEDIIRSIWSFDSLENLDVFYQW